jgi:hypothetical protein
VNPLGAEHRLTAALPALRFKGRTGMKRCDLFFFTLKYLFMNILFWLFRSRLNKGGMAPVMMRLSLDGKRVNFPTHIEKISKTSAKKFGTSS